MKDPTPNPIVDTENPIHIYESHKTVFEKYAGTDIHVELAPNDLETFAFDLEKNTIYLSPRFYKDKFTGDQADEFTVFAILHEIGHFREKLEMLSESDGVKNFQKYLDKIKKDKAYALTDNLIADISINREVVSRTNTDYKKREIDLYTKDLFPITDFTDAPKHIQFGQAILREHRVPDELCMVDFDVRVEINKLRQNEKGDIIDIMTNPDISMSMRLKLLDRFIMPIVEKLKEKDLEDRKKQIQQQKGKNEKGEGEKDESGKSDEGENGDKSDDTNEIFKEDYEKAQKGMMNPKPRNKETEAGEQADSRENLDNDIDKDFEKALEYYLEKNPKAKSLNKEKTPEQIKKESEEQEAKDLGVDLNDLQKYDDTKDSLDKIINPENNKSVIEELSSLFRRIISKRKQEKLVSKAPVEEGAYLSDPASLVAEVRAGNLRPHVWEDVHKNEKQSDKFGEVEISLVFDRSDSMNDDGGHKKIEQRKAAILIMEALSDFEVQLRNAKKSGNLNNELTMKNEIFSFQASSDDTKPLKNLYDKLERKSKIEIAKKLSTTGNSTTDFIPLGVIDNSIKLESIKKIKDGKLKKIVIVMTDGGSDNKTAVSNILKSLTNKGVITIGVGITKSGEPALETYAPKAILAKEVKDLPIVLANILKEHLSDL